MRRATTVALVAMLLALSAGVALAATITCTGGRCEGTKGDDVMDGTAGVDEMYGGGGRDKMAGSDDNDKVYGEAGEDVLGGATHELLVVTRWQLTAESRDPGKDKFYGGPGEDMIFARDCEVSQSENSRENCKGAGTTPTRDIIDCGPGSTDFASFDKKKKVKDVVRNCERLRWTDRSANQFGCAFKPWDNANVKCITGTKRDDKNLVDRDNPDARMLDNMWGNAGNDTLRARRGFDVLAGGMGDDILYGGPGDDALIGDDGGSDKINGEGGDDFINSLDGGKEKDVISCGGGDADWVWIDVGVDEKAPGVPFETSDLAPPLIPHDPAKAPAGCEIVADDGGFFTWGQKARQRKR